MSQAVVCDFCGLPTKDLAGWYRVYRVTAMEDTRPDVQPDWLREMFGGQQANMPRWSGPSDFCSVGCLHGWSNSDHRSQLPTGGTP